MAMTRILSARDLCASLKMADAIEAIDEAMRELSGGGAVMPPRLVTEIPNRGSHLAMAAALPGLDALGAKCITVFPGNPASGAATVLGLMILNDPDTGMPTAVLDATYLTEIRTAAASAVATRTLARSGASSLALIGVGVQASSHLAAMIEVRPLRRVGVTARSRESAERFVAEQSPRYPGLTLRVADSPRDAISQADIVCTVSSATEPVTQIEWMAPGTHLNGVGSHSPHAREVDSETMAAARIIVDSRAAVLAECGDCLIPIEEGRFGPEHVSDEIGQVLAGVRPGRSSEAQITVYQSCGVAVQDVAVAKLALAVAHRDEVGLDVEIYDG